MAYPNRIGTSFGISANGATSLTMSYPAGSVSGDFLVMQAHFTRSATGTSTTIPVTNLTGGATWHLIAQQNDTSANGVYYGYYWTFRGSETSVTMTATTSSSMRSYVADIVAYTGNTVDSTTPVGTYQATYQLSGAGAITTPTVTTPADLCEILLFNSWLVSGNISLTSTWTAPATQVNQNTSYNAAANITYTHSAAYDQKPTSGTTATYTVTPNQTPSQKIVAAIPIRFSGLQPVSDALAAVDDAFVALGVSDAITTADTSSVDANIPVAEAITATEGNATLTTLVAESVSAADSAVVVLALIDAATWVDTATLTISTPKSGTDAAAWVEVALISSPVSTTDAIGAADSSTIRVLAPEVVGAADNAYVSSTVAVTDSATATDSAVLVPQVTETASFVDSALIVVQSMEFAAFTDIISATTASLFDTDAFTAAESTLLLVYSADTTTTTESALVANPLPVADSVAAVELAVLIVRVTDEFQTADPAFNYGDGLRIKGDRIYRVASEMRVFAVPQES